MVDIFPGRFFDTRDNVVLAFASRGVQVFKPEGPCERCKSKLEKYPKMVAEHTPHYSDYDGRCPLCPGDNGCKPVEFDCQNTKCVNFEWEKAIQLDEEYFIDIDPSSADRLHGLFKKVRGTLILYGADEEFYSCHAVTVTEDEIKIHRGKVYYTEKFQISHHLLGLIDPWLLKSYYFKT